MPARTASPCASPALVLRSRLLALAAGLPQFGDGLGGPLSPPHPHPLLRHSPNLPNQVPPASAIPKPRELPIRIDLVSTRTWFGQQVWTPAPAGHTPRTHRGPLVEALRR